VRSFSLQGCYAAHAGRDVEAHCRKVADEDKLRGEGIQQTLYRDDRCGCSANGCDGGQTAPYDIGVHQSQRLQNGKDAFTVVGRSGMNFQRLSRR